MTHSHRVHRRFPERLAFTLSSPFRSFLNPPEQLIRKLGIEPNDVVVDFGCGTGFFTIPIARVAGRTFGIDVSSKMLEKAASYAKRDGVAVEFVRSDGTEIRFEDESVDIVLLVHVFHEVEHRVRVLGEFFRIMRPLGRLIIVEKTRGNIISGSLGPPIINKMEVIQEVENIGFIHTETISHKDDSLIICQKTRISLETK